MDHKNNNLFEKFSNWAVKFTGSQYAFIGATFVVLAWGGYRAFF